MEQRETPQNVIPVNAVTKKKAMALLDRYTRVQGACKTLKTLRNIKDLFVLMKQENRYFTLKGDTVEQLLTQTEESGGSLCKVLMYDLFGLSDSQYRTICKEFAAKDGEYGIFAKDKGQFAIFVNMPGQEAWYNDRRVQKATAAMALAGAGVSLNAYFSGKRASQREKRRVLLVRALHYPNVPTTFGDRVEENQSSSLKGSDSTEIVTDEPKLEQQGNVLKKSYPRPSPKRTLNKQGQLDDEGSDPELQNGHQAQAQADLRQTRAEDDRSDESSDERE
jgi:hypothetical protein